MCPLDLDTIRTEIDAIDNQLLPLFEARMDCSQKVAAVKKENGIPVLNPQREEAILDRMEEKACRYKSEARALYAQIMAISRNLQHQLLESGEALRELLENAQEPPRSAHKVAVLGTPGSFSYAAPGICSLAALPALMGAFRKSFKPLRKNQWIAAFFPWKTPLPGP